MKRDRVLRALSRFDAATVGELAESLGMYGANGQRSIWRQLQKLTAEGVVGREGERNQVARYRIARAA